ncbi:hypothetical protein [Bosea sp. BK604]|uniref:hypothetical protein n=1 Tax=Bosea sp. BK604 TaxID=2512180 RepID=UPI0010E200D2|nr:hypothetical protein [Bosea sp. BK604]TCR69672.1 hypothetical protein EV560_10169 [Bosea sp. BK604]
MAEHGIPWPDGTREEILRRAFKLHQTGREIARDLKLREVSVQKVIRLRKKEAQSGELGYAPVLPGYHVSKTTEETDAAGNVERRWIEQKPAPGDTFEVPAGHVVKGVSALTDPDGNVKQQWVKTREAPPDPLAVAEGLKRAFKGWRPSARPIPAPVETIEDLLTLYPLADWHIGMFAWGRETSVNWDLRIAERVLGAAAADLVEQAPRSRHAILLGGGDLIHSDNQSNRTARSGHQLDVDGRYPKVVMVAARLLVAMADAMLARHELVTIRILKGNHDEHASVAVAYFLLAWFRNEPRVTVDVDPSLFFLHRFGKVMLAGTHGHETRPHQMPELMAQRWPSIWGETLFRYGHTFHLHHKRLLGGEGGGVTVETHQAPIPPDAWHWGAGFLSGRSMQAITYHKDYGEFGRNRIAILDGGAA